MLKSVTSLCELACWYSVGFNQWESLFGLEICRSASHCWETSANRINLVVILQTYSNLQETKLISSKYFAQKNVTLAIAAKQNLLD